MKWRGPLCASVEDDPNGGKTCTLQFGGQEDDGVASAKGETFGFEW